MKIIFVLFILVTFVPNLFADITETQKQQFRSVMDQVNRSNNYDLVIKSINKLYLDINEASLKDDLLLIKAIIQNKAGRYEESNATIENLLRDHGFVFIESLTLSSTDIVPDAFVKVDMMTYINYLRAENYRAKGDLSTAMPYYEEVYQRIQDDKVIISEQKDIVYDVVYGVITSYIKHRKKFKAKSIAKDYLTTKFKPKDEHRDSIQQIYDDLESRDSVGRNPFMPPGYVLQTKIDKSDGKTVRTSTFIREMYNLTGIINEDEKIAIIEYRGNSYLKKKNSLVNGYKVISISDDKIILQKPGTASKVTIMVGEGKVL